MAGGEGSRDIRFAIILFYHSGGFIDLVSSGLRNKAGESQEQFVRQIKKSDKSKDYSPSRLRCSYTDKRDTDNRHLNQPNNVHQCQDQCT